MKVEQKLSIEIETSDVSNFKSVIKKLTKEIAVVGLKNNTITSDESDVLIKLNNALNK